MVNVHTAHQGDINSMYEIDLRSYDYPLGYAELKTLLQDPSCFVVVAADNNKVVGYAVFRKDIAAGFLEIVRLAVMPKERQFGVGSELLKAGRDYGLTANLYVMYIDVPEILCCPGDPDDVSRWLGYKGFKATVPTLPAKFYMYGSTVAGIRFTRNIDVA